MSKRNSFSYICTRALHSFRSFTHWHAASTVIPPLPKATFSPSMQPNLGLPRIRPPLTSAINALLAIRYWFILSTFQNHLNTHLSASLANSPFLFQLSFAPLHSKLYSFVTLKPNFSNTSSQEPSLSISQHFSYPMHLLRTKQLVLLIHINISWPLSPILYCSAHLSSLPTLYILHSFCVPHPSHIPNQLPPATAGTIITKQKQFHWIWHAKCGIRKPQCHKGFLFLPQGIQLPEAVNELHN